MRLNGKTALVTGAASGFGAGIARKFATEGARVAIVDINADAASALAKHLGTIAIAADVSSDAGVKQTISTANEKLGRIDILVNNAGITQPVKTLDITGADYDRILDVSLRGTLYMSQAVIPVMRKQKSGAICCVSSVSAQRGGGILGGPHYSAAKAGVLGLARAMAREFGIDGIRVNCVTPGLIATDINKGLIPEDKLKTILEGIPLNRIGEPADVAGCLVFLASDLAKYLTGVTLDVNGGMLIH